jgi:hypothetical protein
MNSLTKRIARHRAVAALMHAVIIVAVALSAALPASAADQGYAPKGPYAHAPRAKAIYGIPAPHQPPFASRLSSAAWDAQGCWRDCETGCGEHFQACIRFAPLEPCHRKINACNLACQRQCRSLGGPILNWTGLLPPSAQ